jgi:hypothetical protein
MNKQVICKSFSPTILLLAISVLVNCSTFSATESGYTLEYGKDTGKVTTYTITGGSSSTFEMQGQVMGQSVSHSGTVTHVVNGESSNILDHEMVFTTLSINTDSDMSGSASLNVSSLIGMPLKVTSGKKGDNLKFINFKDIPSIELPVPMHLTLIELLPVLASVPVNVLDTWKGLREFTIETADGRVSASSETDYVFAGIEERLGFECVKITATDNISVSGTGKTQGMNIDFSGYGVNTNTYYCAQKEGVLIELDSQTGMSMSVTLLDMGMTIPLEGTGSLKLVYEKQILNSLINSVTIME